MFLALELDDGCDRCPAIMFFEEGCLKGLAWHAFEVPGLHYALWAYDLAEFAVEAVFRPVCIDMEEAPSTVGADIHLLDSHLVFSRPHPLSNEFWISVCTKHGVARRVEGPYDSDLSIVRSRYYGGFRDR